MDVHSIVDSLSSLTQYGFWYTLSFVSVEFVLPICENKTLVIFLDQHRHRVPAFIPVDLMKFYTNMNLVENMFVLSHFQIESFDCENHILIWGEFKIVITEPTKLLPFTSDVPRGFRLYPLVPSIMTLTHDRRSTKLIIDVVGRIIAGERSNCSCELFLQDKT
ncbi:hypothetical protein R6Q57_019845 [Mikania cordata]